MAKDKATQTSPLGSPCLHTTTYPRCYSGNQLSPTTPRPTTSHSSTAITLRRSRPETVTVADQSTTTAVPQSLPQLIRSIWTAQEVNQLVQLQNQGLSWSQVSNHFPGKTANACRKRYERYKKGVLHQRQ